MASAYSSIMNGAMQIDRERPLEAESHQRTADRQGCANGFKPKALRTRVGEVNLRILQTKDHHDEKGRPLYPKNLERGVRSERAMPLAAPELARRLERSSLLPPRQAAGEACTTSPAVRNV
jgi:putative transposase